MENTKEPTPEITSARRRQRHSSQDLTAFHGEQKVLIVLEALCAEISVSELCCKH
jgi:hypothetical protein